MSRLNEPQHEDFHRLNSSLSFDRRLWPQDIAQSRAHARMLAAQAIIADEDRDALLAGLDAVEAELRDARFPFDGGDEDIHMAIERRLTELAGPVAGRLHTARSRNDQVVTDLMMYVRERCAAARTAIGALMATLLARAEQHADWPMPGYTHLQRAQPVYLGHHLLAYFWMLERDRARFAFAESQASSLPLGAGALAGVNFDTDRRLVADELGFAHVAANSIDAVSGRDFVLDYLNAAATCSTHLSRLGAELVLWSSAEFGFCELPDSWSAGSSIMPQKKNPDAAELVRAKVGRLLGSFTQLAVVMKGLPLTYSKDMQEDKVPTFEAFDALELSLSAMAGMVADLEPNAERMAAAAGAGYSTATDLADWLVRELGLPFRDAHHITGAAVKRAEALGTDLPGLPLAELQKLEPRITQGVYGVLTPQASVASRVSYGGTAPDQVRAQIKRWKELLA